MKSNDTTKTNAARILDTLHIPYAILSYGDKDTFHTGAEVADMTGLHPDTLFKTLVCRSDTGMICVFVIPVMQELDLKAAAKAAGEKRIEMLPVKEITGVTGYIKGGCSPIGMKKLFRTFLDESAILFDTIYCSAGRRGLQLGLGAEDLVKACRAEYADLVKK